MRLQDKYYNLYDGQTLVYDVIETNVGDAYNSTSGYFTAPYRGIYSLSIFFQTRFEFDTALLIVVNDSRILCGAETPDWWDMGQCAAIAELGVGDRVCVRSANWNKGKDSGSQLNHHGVANGFLGFLYREL